MRSPRWKGRRLYGTYKGRGSFRASGRRGTRRLVRKFRRRGWSLRVRV